MILTAVMGLNSWHWHYIKSHRARDEYESMRSVARRLLEESVGLNDEEGKSTIFYAMTCNNVRDYKFLRRIEYDVVDIYGLDQSQHFDALQTICLESNSQGGIINIIIERLNE